MKTPNNALGLFRVIVGDILIKNSRRLNSDPPAIGWQIILNPEKRPALVELALLLGAL